LLSDLRFPSPDC